MGAKSITKFVNLDFVCVCVCVCVHFEYIGYTQKIAKASVIMIRNWSTGNES